MYYSFLVEDVSEFVPHVAHMIKDKIPKKSIHYYGYGVFGTHEKDIYHRVKMFMADLISAPNLEYAKTLLVREMNKNFLVRISNRYLEPICEILANSTEENYKDNLMQYRDLIFD